LEKTGTVFTTVLSVLILDFCFYMEITQKTFILIP
jgi:hypothetical protein